MPVRYDIAAQVPQAATGGMDPLNAFATMQAMSYRQQQNALAQMQMQEYQRKLQAEQALRGLSPNFQDPRFAEQVFRYDPDFARQLYGSQLAGERERRMAEQAAAMADETRRRAALAERKFTEIEIPKASLEREELGAKIPGARAETREKLGKATEEDIKAAQRLIGPAFMARTPEDMAARYAEIYGDLPEMARKRLGPRPDMSQLEAFMTTPEAIQKAQEPRVMSRDQMLVEGTGRPGGYTRTEPRYTPPPNALAPTVAPINALAAPPAMMGDETLTPQERIIQKSFRNRALLDQVPPEDRPKVQSQLDLAETVQAANEGVRRLADASGIPVAGQTKVENWKAKARTTKAGLALGNLSDSQVAEEYNNLRTIAGIMRQRVAGAIGLTARQMDAAKEMEAFEKIVGGDPSAEGLASAVRRLNTINQLLGTGEAERFESPRSAPRGKAGEEPKPLGGVVDFGSLK